MNPHAYQLPRVHEAWEERLTPAGAQEAVEPEAMERCLHVLGRSLGEFAPALAALDDFGKMVLSLVHPLVQVYSIPKTGELAYVGHTCNFRQDVKGFMTRLPLRPSEMPMVMVKPRPAAGKASDHRPRNPFKVDTLKIRAAFEWLKRYNVLYAATWWFVVGRTTYHLVSDGMMMSLPSGKKRMLLRGGTHNCLQGKRRCLVMW